MIGVLLVTVWLRWMQPGLVEFKYDEAHIFGMAQEIAVGRAWPLLSGGTSIGAPRSALDAYILALPLALTNGSPQAAIIWLGMLGALAVALTYLLGRLIGGRMTGLLAALYMAANPWLAFYDRKFWAHIQVTFSVLLFVLAWQVVVQNKRRSRFWFPVVAALQLLTHVLALVQALSWLGAFIIAPRRWWRKETGWGALAGLALMSPYFWALGRRFAASGASAAAQAGRIAAGGDGSVLQSVAARWQLAWQLFGGDRIFELAGAGQRLTGWDRSLLWGRWLALAMIAAGFLRLLLWLKDDRRRTGAGLLLLWGLGPALALSFGPLTVYLQYWTTLLPLPALLFALGMSWPLALIHARRPTNAPASRLSGGVALLTLSLAGALLIIWGGAWIGALHRIDAGFGRQTFGRPLRTWQAALSTANVQAAKLRVQQVKVLVNGVDPGQNGDAAAVADLIGNPPYARFLQLSGQNPALLLHADQPSLYLSARSDMNGMLEALGREVWRGAGAEPMRLYLLPPASEMSVPFTRLPEPAVFDVGMALVGFAFPEPWASNRPTTATLVWQVITPAADAGNRNFTAFNHIVRAGTDDKVAQVDGLALLSRDWWPGDVLYQSYQVTIPEAGRFEWLAGLYSQTDGGRAQLPSGGDAASLPLAVGE